MNELDRMLALEQISCYRKTKESFTIIDIVWIGRADIIIIDYYTDKFWDTIFKVIEVSNTEEHEDYSTFRLSLDELMEARAVYLWEEQKENDKFNSIIKI